MPDLLPTDRPITVILQKPRRRWLVWLLGFALFFSMMSNYSKTAALQQYVKGESPMEKFHSGELTSSQKIARIEITGTISPPFTSHVLKSIDRAIEDDEVKGVVLLIDSPGGLVADSHQIYHKLRKLREKKPIYVSMARMAASGGYYVAMGAGPEGKIFAEPTTWTGSIGVIIPRYDFSEIAKTYGVKSDALKTGPYKDALNPLKELGPEERKVWEEIMADAFDRFVEVIDEGRGEALNPEEIKALATGQVYTATQAKKLKLIDEIGYSEEAINALKTKLNLKEARVIRYEFPTPLLELLTSVSGKAQAQVDPIQHLLEASVPRALYFCGWQL